MIKLIKTDGTKSASYKVGPKGSEQLKLSLKIDEQGFLVLSVILPKKAFRIREPGTGKLVQSKVDQITVIRDHDLNGTPEDYVIEPKEKFSELSDADRLFEKEFLPVMVTPEGRDILPPWEIVIGYCVNYLLHDINSSKPSNFPSQFEEETPEETP